MLPGLQQEGAGNVISYRVEWFVAYDGCNTWWYSFPVAIWTPT